MDNSPFLKLNGSELIDAINLGAGIRVAPLPRRIRERKRWGRSTIMELRVSLRVANDNA
jgi:hypothetical protein